MAIKTTHPKYREGIQIMHTTTTPVQPQTQEEQVRESEILFYLVSYESESLSYLVHTLLEQGYTTSEVSAGLKLYIDRSAK